MTCLIDFLNENDPGIAQYGIGTPSLFTGKFLETFFLTQSGSQGMLMGCGDGKKMGQKQIREIFAQVSKTMKKYKIRDCTMNIGGFIEQFGKDAITQIMLGLQLGEYEYTMKTTEVDEWECQYHFTGVDEIEGLEELFAEASELADDVGFARDMTNTPGNLLRPEAFARSIQEYLGDVPVEVEILEEETLRTIGMNALLGVGEGSAFRPCMVIARYRGNPSSREIEGYVGKGITCDTGGYCIKGASSMAGIKGDMAGAAAVVGALHGIASRKTKRNITAIIPICENRISEKAQLPGDVIKSYSGKTIEILNTDAEGRLILADAVSYGVKQEQVTKIVDIATLTGSAYSALGYTMGGALADNDEYYQRFQMAQEKALETYVRFPFGPEHEKMVESEIADVKNIGPNYCGMISAGLFIRCFAGQVPWIHLDIAGTAWCENPAYAYESKGATGAGTLSLYYLAREED